MLSEGHNFRSSTFLGNLCVAASRLGLAEGGTENGQRSDSLQARLFHLDREQLTVQVSREPRSLVGTGFVLCFCLDRNLLPGYHIVNFLLNRGWKMHLSNEPWKHICSKMKLGNYLVSIWIEGGGGHFEKWTVDCFLLGVYRTVPVLLLNKFSI